MQILYCCENVGPSTTFLVKMTPGDFLCIQVLLLLHRGVDGRAGLDPRGRPFKVPVSLLAEPLLHPQGVQVKQHRSLLAWLSIHLGSPGVYDDYTKPFFLYIVHDPFVLVCLTLVYTLNIALFVFA